MGEENKLQKLGPKSGSIYGTLQAFNEAKEIATSLSKSKLVPESYRENIDNTLIALEMANRIGVSPFMIMQNLHIIKGKPSWSSSFIISSLNSCGRFSPLEFEFVGEEKTREYGCKAKAKSKATGQMVEGPVVTWGMVKDEGWFDKPGSKWKTMPELMFQYRAASFFGRLYAPDILNGMQSTEEIIDISHEVVNDGLLDELQDLFEDKRSAMNESDIIRVEGIIQNKESQSYRKAINKLKTIQ